jgi:hypothetical protein
LACCLEGFADIIDGKVLLAHSHDLVADGVAFWRTMWSFARLHEKGALGVLAELVAEHPEATGGIAKALSDLMGGDALDKISSERFILSMSRIGGFKEDALKFC